jgi:excisionase family DNA binding protein
MKAARKMKPRSWFSRNCVLLKRTQGCAACGTHDGEFVHHHIDSSTRRSSVAAMSNRSMSAWLDEMAKCVVLCRSCHAVLHGAERRNRPRRPVDLTRGAVSLLQAARELGVNKAAVIRWLQKREVAGWRTPGGHWRIPVTEIERLRAEVKT